MLEVFTSALLACAAVIVVLAVLVRSIRRENEQHRMALLSQFNDYERQQKHIVGFFHPYCNAGGGGERVLWTAVKAMQRTEPHVISVVYSGDTDATKEQIIEKVQARFAITLDPKTLYFVFLQSRYVVEDSTWKHFTLAGQSLGSMWLAYEAMRGIIPDLYIDTMGYAFTFPVVRLLGGCPVGAYVHYPTISTDMLARVRSRTASHVNADVVRRSGLLSQGKLIYYRIFMQFYARCLRTASFLMVNSSWTKNHVDSILTHRDVLLDPIFSAISAIVSPAATLASSSTGPTTRVGKEAQIVYPPCDTREMVGFPLERREQIIVSVQQFRPEKEHAVQVRAFHELLKSHPEHVKTGLKLVLVGGSRNAGDAARIESLRELTRELKVDQNVEFAVNASYPDMLRWLSRASVGINTMVDEHFGINVVEYMAAGVIPVAHASGGPLNDIIVPYKGERTGYHATDPQSFSDALHTALTLPPLEDRALRQRARAWAVHRFSEEEFDRGWAACGWHAAMGVPPPS